MPPSNPFAVDDLTASERNAMALARADLQMLAALVKLRQEKGLTQEAVAAELGRDKSAVSRFERLDSDPRMSTVRRYARAIGALVEHDVTDFVSSGPQPAPLAQVLVFAPRETLVPSRPPSGRELVPAGIRYAGN